jgi:hypothetical protein
MCVTLVVLMMGLVASAQIRIVPQERLDSIANPRTLGDGNMHFEGGNERNFGVLKESDKPWSTRLVWSNGSKQPLVVTRVTTSCSCVSADYSRAVVESDGKGWLEVRFNPLGRVGGVRQRVYLYTNLSERVPTAVVTLYGRVESAPENGDYPEAMGELRVQRRVVTFAKGCGGVASIACRNVGSKALRVTLDERMPGCEGVTLRCEPEVLNGGENGVLVIECDKSVERSTRIYVGGVEAAPSRRVIDIVVE